MAALQGLFGRMAADQAGRAGDEDGFRSIHVHAIDQGPQEAPPSVPRIRWTIAGQIRRLS